MLLLYVLYALLMYWGFHAETEVSYSISWEDRYIRETGVFTSLFLKTGLFLFQISWDLHFLLWIYPPHTCSSYLNFNLSPLTLTLLYPPPPNPLFFNPFSSSSPLTHLVREVMLFSAHSCIKLITHFFPPANNTSNIGSSPNISHVQNTGSKHLSFYITLSGFLLEIISD